MNEQPAWGQQPSSGGQSAWGQPPAWGPPAGGPGAGPGAGGYGPPPAYGPAYGPPYGPGGYGPPGGPGGPGGWRPALRPGIIPLRPLALGEILDGAFQAIRTNPRTMLGVSALVMAVIAALTLVPQFYLTLQTRSLGNLAPEASEAEVLDALAPLAAAAGGLILTSVLALVAGAVLSALLVVAVSEAVIGRRLAPRTLWTRVRTRLGAVVGLALLSVVIPVVLFAVGAGVTVAAAVGLDATGSGGVLIGVVVAVLLLLTLAAMVWVWAGLALSGPALLLERVGVLTALRRSWRLVSGSWWRVFGILLLAAVIAGVGQALISLPFTQGGQLLVLTGDLSVSSPGRVLLGTMISAVGGIVAGTVMAPFQAGVTSLLYIDRRMRAEGLDLELARAAQESAGGGPLR